MTVQELINKLKTLNPDLPIFMESTESGRLFTPEPIILDRVGDSKLKKFVRL